MDSVGRGSNAAYEAGLRSQAEGVKIGDKYYMKRELSVFRGTGFNTPWELYDFGRGKEVTVTACNASSREMLIGISFFDVTIEQMKTITIGFDVFFNFFSPSRRQGTGDPMKMGDERMLAAVDPEGGFKERKHDTFTVDDIRRIAFEKVAAKIRSGNVGSEKSREPEDS